MNFIEFELPQKLRGGFYTQPDIAAFLARWVATLRPERVLEPSCGDGAVLAALQSTSSPRLLKVFACELNPEEAAKAQKRVPSTSKRKVEIHCGDFLDWFLSNADTVRPFDCALGNPPFIRYQYLPDDVQRLAERIFARYNLPFTKHTNAWVPFVLASLALLRPGGRLAMVVPSELLHIPHAQSLRRMLAEQCSRILLMDPEEIWFGDTLQGTLLLLAEKKLRPRQPGKGVAVIPVADRQLLQSDPETLFQNAAYACETTTNDKWMAVFLSGPERALLAGLKQQPTIRRFKDLAQVDVGIVTGANNFFLVPDAVVEEHGLQRWAYPMFGRSDHVEGLIYSDRDHASNKKQGLPANFLWFQEENLDDLPENVRDYLREGVKEKLPNRYKCRVRKPWFKVPSVSTAPIGMLKRAHRFPRLILNQAKAYTTDTAYRIKSLGVQPQALVLAFVNSLTCLTAELEGRHYGGGVLELVPSEIERLLIPQIEATPAELSLADEKYRRASQSAFLRDQDSLILDRVGIARNDRERLHAAWTKLCKRRLRVSAGNDKDA
jgi:adenine-specific DNA-methyltransferase